MIKLSISISIISIRILIHIHWSVSSCPQWCRTQPPPSRNQYPPDRWASWPSGRGFWWADRAWRPQTSPHPPPSSQPRAGLFPIHQFLSFFLSLLFAYMGNTHFVQHGKNLGFALVGRLFHRTTQRSASRLGSGSGSRSSRLRSRFSLHSSSLGGLLSLLLLTLTGLLLVVGVLGDGDFSLFITHVNSSLTMLATKMGAGRISIWNPSRTRAASRVSGNTALMQACSEQRQRQAVSWG